jgi:hypothetical protein
VRRLPLLLLMLSVSSTARAQIGRSPFSLREPSAWVSAGVALQQSWAVTDGSTGSRWAFGNSVPWHVSLEKTVNGGTSVGIRGSTALVPLNYSDALGTREADANVSQIFGTLHVASGREFHTVLELSAGTTLYSNFRERTTGTKVGPAAPDADFTFLFGYGFGYAFNPRFAIDVVQDVSTALHQKTGLSAGDDSSTRLHGTRLVGRIGLGGR